MPGRNVRGNYPATRNLTLRKIVTEADFTADRINGSPTATRACGEGIHS